MAELSLYDVLNVAPSAEPEVIEAAYRALMKKYHPDKALTASQGGPAAAEINAAFAVLRNPRRRSDYDARLSAQRATVPPLGHAWPPQRPAAPAPRRFNAAAWTGWSVALALGCFAATMPIGAPMTSVAPNAAVPLLPVAAAEQPMDLQPASAIAAADSSLLLARSPSIEEVLVEPVQAPAAAEAPAPVQEARPVARAATPLARRAAPSSAPRRARPPQPRQTDRDFLEREGFIY